jgi:hypothetical protein
MRRLIAGITLIALNSAVGLAQQKDQPGSKLPTPAPTGSLVSSPPLDVAPFQLPAPHFPFHTSEINTRLTSSSGQASKQDGPFVFQNGALYMRVPGSQLLMPVSGGGASGCFTLDLLQRIGKLKEFIPGLDPLEPPRPLGVARTTGNETISAQRRNW